MPFNWIIEKHAKVYQRDPSAYDWRNVNVRFVAAEQEIAREEYVHTLGDETKRENRKAEKEFRAIFTKARPAFDKIFQSGRERPSLEEVTKVLVAEGGAHFEIAADLFERATGKRPPNSGIKDFVERCPPFKALIMALCFSQYDICIRGDNVESLGKAGRVDMFSAVFLPYSKIFVTRDEGQNKALTAVAKLMELETSVVMYEEFKSNLFGLRN